MRLPDWLYRRIERCFRAQRSIRDRELHAEIERQDRVMRYHFAWERFAHAHRQCFEGCTYRGH